MNLRARLKGQPLTGFAGHFLSGKSGERIQDALKQGMLLFDTSGITPEVEAALQAAWATGVAMSKPVYLGKPYLFDACPYCGSQSLPIYYDGQSFSFGSERPCPNPNGISLVEFDLNVPSGVLAVANNLKDCFPDVEDRAEEAEDSNSIYQQFLTSHNYARVGLAFGHTHFSVHKTIYHADGRYVIVGEEESCPDFIAYIPSNYSGYSICDKAELQRRAKHYKCDLHDQDITFITVKPGVYRFTHSLDEECPIIAGFRWVRKPQPVVDFVRESMRIHNTALECLVQDVGGVPNSQQATAFADRILCVIGTGINFHPNGFPRGRITQESRQIAREMGGIMPPLDTTQYWYPLCDFSPIAKVAGVGRGVGLKANPVFVEPTLHLNSSFLDLGLKLCQSLIQHPCNGQLCRDVWPPQYLYNRRDSNVAWAIMCYQGIRKRYPSSVRGMDATFDAWVMGLDACLYVQTLDHSILYPPKEEWHEKPEILSVTQTRLRFDATNLAHGYFVGAHGGWSDKKNAVGVALHQRNHASEFLEDGLEFSWNVHGARSVPLQFTARVIGHVRTANGNLLEIEVDGVPGTWGITEKLLPCCTFSD